MECRNLVRASKNGINTPTVLFADFINRKIYLQFIDNSTQLKEVLKIIYQENNFSNQEKLVTNIVSQLGSAIAKLHNSNIIHGDLTTSNMLLKLRYLNLLYLQVLIDIQIIVSLTLKIISTVIIFLTQLLIKLFLLIISIIFI